MATFPVESYRLSQTYLQHIAKAIAEGKCYKPDTGCKKGMYYYPGLDIVSGNQLAYPPVKAPVYGWVVEAGMDKYTQANPKTGYGNQVRIKDERGYLIILAHLSFVYVKVGQEVQEGDIVGLMGSTGNSTGVHTHFEVRDPNGIPVDPYEVYTFDQVPVEDNSSNTNTKVNPGMVKSLSPDLRIRTSPTLAIQNTVGYVGDHHFEATGETSQDGNVTFRKCYVWIAERGGTDAQYLVNV